MKKQQEKLTKSNIHPDLLSKQQACTNVLIEKEVDNEVFQFQSKGRNVYMVLCVLSQMYSLSMLTYFTFAVLIKTLFQDKSSAGGAIQIFEAASNAGLTVTSAFSIYNSWKRRHLFLEVIERTRVTCMNNRKLRIICAMFYGCSVTFLVGFGIIEWLLKIQKIFNPDHAGSLDNFSSNDSDFLLPDKEADGNEKNFFDAFGSVHKNDMNGSYVISLGKFFIIAAMFTYLILYYSVCHALFMLLMLTVKQTGNEFRKKLKLEGYQHGNYGFSKGVELYRELKKTTELIKKLFGNSMIGYYLATVAYLAVAPHVLLGNQGKFERVIIIYLAFSFFLWIIAAEFHHQVRSSVLKWTEYHFARNDLSSDNPLMLFYISHDISSTQLTSIAVANKCFAVTYRHLCSMFSLIVTYGIIVFQLHNGQFQAIKNTTHVGE